MKIPSVSGMGMLSRIEYIRLLIKLSDTKIRKTGRKHQETILRFKAPVLATCIGVFSLRAPMASSACETGHFAKCSVHWSWRIVGLMLTSQATKSKQEQHRKERSAFQIRTDNHKTKKCVHINALIFLICP